MDLENKNNRFSLGFLLVGNENGIKKRDANEKKKRVFYIL